MRNWKKTALLSLGILFLLLGYMDYHFKTEKTASEFRGSFTADKTYSYDEKYYAIQKVEKEFGADFPTIKVSIYETETDTLVFCFYPARAWDFWGICWENDTYNIWIQSGDIGTYCYKYEEMQWIKDESIQRPEYIISRWDKYSITEKAHNLHEEIKKY